MSDLALFGGKPITNGFTSRLIFGYKELLAVRNVFVDSWKSGVDFGFQGKYEKLFCENFCSFQSDSVGYADAVSSGTAGLFIALQSLELKQNSEILVSPATNPGSVSPALILGYNVVPIDSYENSFLMSPKALEDAITSNTAVVIVTHYGGLVCDMPQIMNIARKYNIKVIEDCSQAHGATYKSQKIGTFGDIAVFSTMFSKTLAAGGSSGIVYTQNEKYYKNIRSYSDRGKPFEISGFNMRMFHQYKFAALNFNSDELSCAIGNSVLKRLDKIVEKRAKIVNKINTKLKKYSKVLKPIVFNKDTNPSFFFHTLLIDLNKLNVSKDVFVSALIAEGIPINPHHREIVSEWEWLNVQNLTYNALNTRNISFNLLFHENIKQVDIDNFIKAVIKVEKEFLKNAN